MKVIFLKFSLLANNNQIKFSKKYRGTYVDGNKQDHKCLQKNIGTIDIITMISAGILEKFHIQ